MRFKGSCLRQSKAFAPINVVNVFIVYELDAWSRDLRPFLLYEAVKLTMILRIGFDSCLLCSILNSWGKNVIISGVDNNSSVHTGNKKSIFALGEGPRQGLDNTLITAEKKYSIDSTEYEKRFVLSLHYNGSNSFLFANATNIYQFKAKDFELKLYM